MDYLRLFVVDMSSNFALMIVALFAAIVLLTLIRWGRKSDERQARLVHEREMEKLRLSSTKELTVRRDDAY